MRTRRGGWLLLCLLTTAIPALVAAVRSGSPFLGTPPGPAALRIQDQEIDLGTVPTGVERIVEVPWHRIGPGSLRVLAVKTGCGCARAAGIPDTLPEGGEGTLTVRLSPRHEAGPFSVWVRTFLDALPPEDVRTVTVRGYVGDRPVANPDVLDLRARSPGAQVTQRLEISAPPGVEPLAVRAALEGLEGEARVVEPMIRGRRGADILLTCRAPTIPGIFQGRLVVSASDFTPFVVPVRGLVVAGPARPER